jgi:hypothetical protein
MLESATSMETDAAKVLIRFLTAVLPLLKRHGLEPG